jgi:hypothetical protein
VGLRDILTGRHSVQGPAPEKLFAISTAYIALATEHDIQPTGRAAIVFQPLATSEFEATMRDMEEVVKATGAEGGTQVASQNDSYGYRWMVVSNPPSQPSVEDLAVAINAVSDSIEGGGHGERLLCAVFAFHHVDAVGGDPAGDSTADPAGDSTADPAGDGVGAPARGSVGAPARGSVGAPARGSAGAPAGGSTSAAGDVPSWAADLTSGTLTPGVGLVYFIYNYKRGYWYPFVPAPGDEQRSTERELQLKAQMAKELPIEPEMERWFPLWGIPI